MIVNPRGGVRRGGLQQIQPVLMAANIDLNVVVTTYAGHASQFAQEMDLRTCNGSCIVGGYGDGTIHEVADGLLQRREPILVPLGIIPAGTGNTVAQHLKCDALLEAARRITRGQVLRWMLFR